MNGGMLAIVMKKENSGKNMKAQKGKVHKILIFQPC